MTVDESLLHPSVLKGPQGPARRTYLDTLQALAGSARMPDEMAEATAVLNPLLDAQLALEAVAKRILKAAEGARDARSGMACDLALDALRLALDDARALTGQTS